MRRICQKQIETAPHEMLLVLDAARVFHQFTPIAGSSSPSLDGSAKGGIAALIQKELKIPIRWVGLGKKKSDLAPFDPEEYVDALLGSPS
jgi:fused signal recognition particle receptor